ncbi:MAG: SMI1/KNR4 family protein [Oleispira sp.]
MDELAEKLLVGSTKKLFGRRPYFVQTEAYNESDFDQLEKKLGLQVPEDLINWLKSVGYGQINRELSIEKGWIQVFDNSGFGKLNGALGIAQDDLGNYIVLNPNENWNVYYLCHDPMGIALICESFKDFVSMLSAEDFQIGKIVNDLEIDESELDLI